MYLTPNGRIPLRKLITYDAPLVGAVSSYGRDLIIECLREQERGDYREIVRVLEDEEFEWIWETKRGKFVKRLSALFHSHGKDIASDLRARVGAIARENSEKGGRYYFDFDDQFVWECGDFGDEGSCFWDSNDMALPILRENGALAIRFFKPYKGGKYYGGDYRGYARAFIAQWNTPKKHSAFVIFNGYGICTLEMARVFASWVGLEYKQVQARNYGTPEGGLYINNGKGVLVGEPEAIERIKMCDLKWWKANEPAPRMVCCECKKTYESEDIRETPGGEHMCLQCYNDLYRPCDRCGEDAEHGRMTIMDDPDGDMWCEVCIANHSTTCEHCGDCISKDDLCRVLVGEEQVETWCRWCCESDSYHCDKCERDVSYKTAELHTEEDVNICDYCHKNKFTCALCEETCYYPAIRADGRKVCRKCAGKLPRCQRCGELMILHTDRHLICVPQNAAQ